MRCSINLDCVRGIAPVRRKLLSGIGGGGPYSGGCTPLESDSPDVLEKLDGGFGRSTPGFFRRVPLRRKSDAKALFSVASKAQAATDYLVAKAAEGGYALPDAAADDVEDVEEEALLAA